MNNYYLYKHSFHNALITNDSLIKYAWMTSQSNVPGLLDINSQIYEAMEDNKNAFKTGAFFNPPVTGALRASEGGNLTFCCRQNIQRS